jgi:hypothetical protein
MPISVEIDQWKEGLFAIFFNHKDNGLQPEENEGSRYEADFTIANSLEEANILQAIHRNLHDEELDKNVIHNIQVEGKQAINVIKEYPADLPQIKSVAIVTDANLLKEADVITSSILTVDDIIKKVAGNVANYVIDLSEGQRTQAVDTEIKQLKQDGNIIITAQ